MSIDATVKTVHFYENGGGRLNLVGRPPDGNRGVKSLEFRICPEEVSALNGCNIWGDSCKIYLGEKEIAKRDGYGSIDFCDREKFIEAIRIQRSGGG